VGQLVSEAIAFHMEDEIINGNGVGKCLGILNAPCLVSQAKESGQAAATIVPDNIVKMRSRVFAPSRANSIWIANQDIEPQLHLMTKTDSGGTGWGYSTYLPANGSERYAVRHPLRSTSRSGRALRDARNRRRHHQRRFLAVRAHRKGRRQRRVLDPRAVHLRRERFALLVAQ